jgi:hypothetical protein
VIALIVPGEPDQTSTIELAEGESRTLTLTVQERRVEVQKPVVPAPSGGGSSSKRTVGFVLGGIGVAGLIGAGITGGLLLSKNAEITAACPNKRCDPGGLALIESTRPLNVVNGVAWGVGLAGLASGVVFLVLSRGDGAATAIAPTALPGGGGLRVTHTF